MSPLDPSAPQGASPLAPPGAGTAPPALAMDPLSPILGATQQAHAGATALFEQTSRAMDRVGLIMREFGKLRDLGVSVTPDDVVDGAGKLAADGVDPHELATLLADMPPGGEALAEWIEGHEAQWARQRAAIAQAHSLMRHETGVSGLRLLQAAEAQGRGALGAAQAGGIAPPNADIIAAGEGGPGPSAPPAPSGG